MPHILNSCVETKEGTIVLPACGVLIIVKTSDNKILLNKQNETYSLPNIIVDNSFAYKDKARNMLMDSIHQHFYLESLNYQVEFFSINSTISINGSFIDVMWDVQYYQVDPHLKFGNDYEFVELEKFLNGEIDTSMEQINTMHKVIRAQVPF